MPNANPERPSEGDARAGLRSAIARLHGRWPVILMLGSQAVLLPMFLLGPWEKDTIGWAFARGQRANVTAIVVIASVFGGLALVAAWFHRGGRGPRWLISVMALGFGLPWAYGVSSAGPHELEYRLWERGHGEFVRIAEQQETEGLIRHYETLIQAREWTYPRSKPPGALMIYQAITEIADGPMGSALGRAYGNAWGSTFGRHKARERRITATFLFVFPLLTTLTVLPLFLLARRSADESTAQWAVFLFILAPSNSIMVLTLDTAVFPLLATTAALLAWVGRRWATFLAGAVLSIGLFTTFSLLPVIPLVGGFVLVRAWTGSEGSRVRKSTAAVMHGALLVLGLALPHLLLFVAYGYDPIRRFDHAMEFHEGWKPLVSVTYWHVGNLVQYATWLGPPVVVAATAEAFGAFRSLGPKRATAFATTRPALFYLAVFLGPLIVFTSIFGSTKSEVMRIWQFFVPFVCIIAAHRLADWSRGDRGLLLGTVVVLQVATCILHKGYGIF